MYNLLPVYFALFCKWSAYLRQTRWQDNPARFHVFL